MDLFSDCFGNFCHKIVISRVFISGNISEDRSCGLSLGKARADQLLTGLPDCSGSGQSP